MGLSREELLRKATIDTTGAAGGLLDPEQSSAFLRTMKEKTAFSKLQRLDIRRAPSGELNKLSTASRIIRAANENSDDGYRVGALFPVVNYVTKKVRLPWEVTEDTFHENIEGEQLEADLIDEMTLQFALDLEDLEWNGDESSADPFLQINEGILEQLTTAAVHVIDGSTINAGVWVKDHYFAAANEMPNKYWSSGNLVWAMSPKRHLDWIETVTDRATAAGDQALIASGPPTDRPVGVPIVEVPSMPDTSVVLLNPKTVRRVVSWEIRKRKVTGETDSTLAATDKRFYVFHIKHDVIIEEDDAIVLVDTIDAI